MEHREPAMLDFKDKVQWGAVMLALGALLWAEGCKRSPDSRRGAGPDSSVLRPGPPVAAPKKTGKATPRARAPDASVQGKCLYPPAKDYVRFAELMFKDQHPAAFGQLSAMLRKYPDSALLRVRVASVLMRAATTYPSRAQKLYREALDLEKSAGCELSPRFRWLALNGLASTHMDLKDHAGAVRWLRQAVRAWPNSAATRYNLACALCMVGQVDACYQELVATLRTCASRKLPAVEGTNKPAYHYAKLSQTDPDLARLRADPRFEELIRPHLLSELRVREKISP